MLHSLFKGQSLSSFSLLKLMTLHRLLNVCFQLDGRIALSFRGNCEFTEKAKHAEAAGASALLVINDKEGLFFELFSKWVCVKIEALCCDCCLIYSFFFFWLDIDEMGCVEKDVSLNVTIPVLMISKSSGYALYKSMVEHKSGECV